MNWRDSSIADKAVQAEADHNRRYEIEYLDPASLRYIRQVQARIIAGTSPDEPLIVTLKLAPISERKVVCLPKPKQQSREQTH